MTRTIAMLALAVSVGCADSNSNSNSNVTNAEFALMDVNPTSATHDAFVSPSDHVGRVSAWYFGHAT
jgi:hypothetical protein